MRRSFPLIVLLFAAVLLAACQPAAAAPPAAATAAPVMAPESAAATSTPAPAATATASPSPEPTPTQTPEPTPTPEVVRFATIGDFGSGTEDEGDVAELIDSWDVDFILALGDNNYPSGEAATIDDNIGQFYGDYIYPYRGEYGSDAEENRFWPVPGNHDWMAEDLQPYIDYFTLPGNERYYDFERGPVHFYALDSDPRNPDGVSADSVQAKWLQAKLSGSISCWNVVFFHAPPYSSGSVHGPTGWMQWPFAEWDVDAVLSGHEHVYERLMRDDIVYFVNGLGGYSIYDFGPPLDGSAARYNDDYGAMRVEAGDTQMTYEFVTRSGEVVDSYTMTKDCSP